MSGSNMYEKPRNDLRQYAAKYGKTVLGVLGNGVDGVVYSTADGTAIKGYRFSRHYEAERNAYHRLRDRNVTQAGPFKIPEFVQCDDALQVVEMRIVTPPFLLDFTSAYLDRRPPFSYEELETWHEEKEEQFGKHVWPIVDEALSILKGQGLWLSDVHPGNVRFENDPSE